MSYIVRDALPEDLVRIEEIYAYARAFMASHGNPNQWGKTNPPHAWLVDDIEKQLLHVIENETGIHGVFYFKTLLSSRTDYVLSYSALLSQYSVALIILNGAANMLLRFAVDFNGDGKQHFGAYFAAVYHLCPNALRSDF